MPAYYIGEHKISNVALFDDYLAKVVPMVERFGGNLLLELNRPAEAVTYFQRTLTRTPGRPKAIFGMSSCGRRSS
jgi:uncharacterized protein (DUF1330 family)